MRQFYVLRSLIVFVLVVVMGMKGWGQTATIFNYQNTTATIPTSWTLSNNVSTNPIDQGTYLLLDAGATSDMILTPSYDLSSYASAALTLDVATFGSGTAFPAKIEISYNNGTSYTQTAVTSTPSSSTYIPGQTVTLNSVSAQVKIRISNNGTSGRGVRLQNIKLVATLPTVTTPGAPTINSITPGNASLSVAFTAPASNGGAAISNYQYSIDGGTSYIAVSPVQTTSPIVISGLSNGTSYSVLIKAVNSAGAGAASGSVTGTPSAAPILSVSGALAAVNTTYGTPSATPTSFTVSGTNLTDDLAIAVPSGFEISQSGGNGYGLLLSLTPSNGSVATTTIYVRLAGTTAAGSYSGNLTLTSNGATTVSIATAPSQVVKKALTISGLTAQGKEYDRLTTASLTGAATYAGLENGESFVVSDAVSWAYVDASVGTNKALTRTGSYSVPTANYTITQPSFTASITAKALSIANPSVNAKVFDGNTTAIITGTLSGVITGDVVSLIGSGTFASSNAGTNIAVTSTSTIGGASASNYTLTQPTGLTADISKADQTITFAALPAKTTADIDFSPGATSSSSGTNAITYTSSNTSVATIVGSNIHIIGAGTTTIIASQASSANYNAATSVSQTLTVTLAPSTLAAWDFNAITSGSPPATYAATTYSNNLDATTSLKNITRGTGAVASGANSSFRTTGFSNDGISTANNDYFQTTLKTRTGYSLSISTINAVYNGTTTYYASPGVTSQYAYSLDGTNFTLIGSAVTSTTTSSNVSVNTSAVAALQNVPSGTTVFIRYYASGQTSTGGWGFSSATSGTNGLAFLGFINCATPNTFNVTGGGSFCSGGSGVTVGLSGSELNVNYQLKANGTNTGSPIAGTGSAISFGNQATGGTYTVVATNVTGSCNQTAAMNGSVIVTVNPLPTATISGTTSICQNSTSPVVTFTGANGTAPYTFTYNVGGGSDQTISTTSGNSVTLSVPTGTPGAFAYNLVSVQGQYCSQTQTGTATVTVSGNVFTGSGNWSVASNWSCGVVPASGDKVSIGSNVSAIMDNDFTIGAAGSLFLRTNANLTIAPGKTLTINGTANFNNQNVTFKSDATGTGTLGKVSGTLTAATNVTVERYHGAQRGWRMINSPVITTKSIFETWQNGGSYTPGVGTLISGPDFGSGDNGLDAATNNFSIYNYNGLVDTFPGIRNTKTAILKGGYLIFIRGDRDAANISTGSQNATVLKATGKLLVGDTSVPLTPGTGKYTFIGNPYVSPIDFEKLYQTNSANINPVFYVWGKNVNSFGGYVTVQRLSNGSYEAVPSDAISTGDLGSQSQHIQPGQAFFVENKTETPGTLTISEDHKSLTSTPGVFRGGTQVEKMRVNMYAKDSTLLLVDGVLSLYDNNNTVEVGIEDAAKFYGFDESLAIIRSNNELSIEGRPLIDKDDTTYLEMGSMKQKAYRFVLTASNFNAEGMAAFLEDSYLHTSTPVSLSGNTTVDFVVNKDAKSSVANRFRIVYHSSSVLPVTLATVKAAEVAGSVKVEWQVQNEAGIRSYEVERSNNSVAFGPVTSVTAGASAYAITDAGALEGANYYRIRIVGVDGSIRYSSIVKVNVGKRGKAEITIYPNPVSNGVMNVYLANVAAGSYTLNMYSRSGQKVFTSVFSHAGTSSNRTIPVSKRLSHGSYTVEIISGATKTTQQIIIN